MVDFSDDEARFRSRMEEAGLGAYVDYFLQFAWPSARLEQVDGDAEVAEIGSTRLGGVPDLPPGTTWPRYEGRPLSFITQVDLAETAGVNDVYRLLPHEGLLSFFYDAVEQPWGLWPNERGASAVLHSPAGVTLERHPHPPDLDERGILPAIGLRPRPELTFMPFDAFPLADAGMTPDDTGKYWDVLQEPEDTRHRLLGHPDLIQGDARMSCELLSHGHDATDNTVGRGECGREHWPAQREWCTLLQIDSLNDPDMLWGDGGRIYFMMRMDDLRAGAWERVWHQLQCY